MSEKKYVMNMLDQFAKPGAIFAMVADSYDVFKFCEMLGDDREIKQKIEDHGKTGGFVVIRPDSGDPVEVNRRLVEILGEKFGYTVNSKGFKVLNNVRLIQGDGINELTVRTILGAFMAMGWSADNIAFGMGGALLQIVDRDTQKFALKASSACINGIWVDVQKDPATDPGKKSKKGRVTLYKSDGQFVSGIEGIIPNSWTDKSTPWQEALEEVFRDGKLTKEYTFAEVRANANMG
jgi:nicotinamide phosphoribosyltransferase